MPVMLSKTYEAFKDAGASDERAREAAEEIAAFDASVTSHVICRMFNGSLLVVQRQRGGWHEALRGDFGEGRA